MKSRCFICLGIVVASFWIFSSRVPDLQGAEKKEVTLGYTVSLTGKFAVEGNETQRGYQLWLEQTSKAGGLQVGTQKVPVKIITYDDESDASTSVKLYEKLITGDKVDMILSPWSSAINFAVSAI